jgi:excisionase family DNA binding protein
MNHKGISQFSGTAIHLGRILENLSDKGLTQDESDKLIKIFVEKKRPENVEDYLIQLKMSVDSLFQKLIISIVNYNTQNVNFIELAEENNITEKENILTIEMVCEEMKISRPTIYNWFKRGLKKIVIGKRVYIHKSDLDVFINEQKS